MKYRVRYHRPIRDERGAVIYEPGTLLDSLDLVPPGQQDRVYVVDDVPDEEEEPAADAEF